MSLGLAELGARMNTLMFDTRLPAAALEALLRRVYPQGSLTFLGNGDAAAQIYSATFSSPDERERFRDLMRNLEVELGLRKAMPPRAVGRMSDLVDSFAHPQKPSPTKAAATRPDYGGGPAAAAPQQPSRDPGRYSYCQRPNQPPRWRGQP
jgi:hypothetical protein